MFPQSTHNHGCAVAIVIVAMTVLGSGGSARAQAPAVDARRVEELKDAVQTEINYVESESLDAVQPLLAQLEELRDEVGYMRVSIRRGQKVEEREYRLVESRLLGVREAVRRLDVGSHGRSGERPPAPAITTGTELQLRMPDRLDAPTAREEVWFDAVTTTELAHGPVMIPAGSVIRGSLHRHDGSARTDRRAGLVVTLREITVHGRTYVADFRVTEAKTADGVALAIESAENAAVLVGDGSAVDLMRGAVLKVRFESPLELTE